MGGRINLDGETLNLNGGTRPPRPPYNLSTAGRVLPLITGTPMYNRGLTTV